MRLEDLFLGEYLFMEELYNMDPKDLEIGKRYSWTYGTRIPEYDSTKHTDEDKLNLSDYTKSLNYRIPIKYEGTFDGITSAVPSRNVEAYYNFSKIIQYDENDKPQPHGMSYSISESRFATAKGLTLIENAQPDQTGGKRTKRRRQKTKRRQNNKKSHRKRR